MQQAAKMRSKDIIEGDFVEMQPKDVTNNSYIIFCPEYKYCKDIDVTNAKSAVDARHTFSLWNGGTVPLEFTSVPYSREQLIYKCKTNKYYCASLIYFDGWQISKDYPW